MARAEQNAAWRRPADARSSSKAMGCRKSSARARVIFGIERQGRIVLGKTMPIGKVGILLLQMTGIGQQNSAQDRCVAVGAENGPPESVLHQQRQIAGMIQMRVGQHDGRDAGRRNRQRRPVAQAQRLEALKQAAIDQNARCRRAPAGISSPVTVPAPPRKVSLIVNFCLGSRFHPSRPGLASGRYEFGSMPRSGADVILSKVIT